MGFLDQLYREAVLEHARRPRNLGRLPAPTVRQEGSNPSCGDELELDVQLQGRVLDAAAFTGHGCAISQASASMMTELIRGRSVEEVRALIERFKGMIHGSGAHPSLGDAAALEGVSKLHARVKCATLAWTTLEAALSAARDQAVEGSESGAPSASSSEPEGRV